MEGKNLKIANIVTETAENCFAGSLQHLLAELERIDLLIAAEVAQARRRCELDEQFRGLYISEEDVDALLRRPTGLPQWAQEPERHAQPKASLEQLARQIDLRKRASLACGVELRLPRLQQIFGLTPFEIDILLVCLAVELDLRYERIYAYLQDDVTKKRPSIDLVLSLLAPSIEMKFAVRSCLSATAPLVKHSLLEFVDDPAQNLPPFPARYLKINHRITGYLLGFDDLEERIRSAVLLRDPQDELNNSLVNENAAGRIEKFLNNGSDATGALLYLRGPYGTGRESTAAAICRNREWRLLIADLEGLLGNHDVSWETALSLVQREAKLQRAAVYWTGFDALLDEQKAGQLKVFLRCLEARPVLTFLAGERLWEPSDTIRAVPFARIEFPRTAFSERVRVWDETLNGRQAIADDVDIAALATKFKFTAGQIQDAAATAGNLARLDDAQGGRISNRDLYEACRLHSNQSLVSLARKITPKYHWDDIVLPADRLEQLREICNHVKYRDRVYGDWGFDHKLSLGKGLSVLFAGPSGTGKTMAAEIIAGELGLELYKIDLSTVVSKYIGETEKNLSRIFTEAETSNAILFFDEADALFGKRSEVKDSHDRYANIETGYLLQRMEEYEGVVVLATNLRKNMDDAFVRRLHFTVEFPFPNQEDRRRIWTNMWPEDTPLSSALDFDLLAGRFEVSGGNIRNIALSAAFLAADGDGVVEMPHLLRAVKREYQKMGKVVAQGEFIDSPQSRTGSTP